MKRWIREKLSNRLQTCQPQPEPLKQREPRRSGLLKDFKQNMWPCSVHPDSPKRSGSGVCRECSRLYRRKVYAAHGASEMDKYTGLVSSARLRGLECTLTFEEWRAIVSLPCVYAYALTEDIRSGVDRRDNAQGYTRGNGQPCCARHNEIKSDVFTHEEMADLVIRYGVACGNARGGRKRITGTHMLQAA
jgi:hypothetical protein